MHKQGGDVTTDLDVGETNSSIDDNPLSIELSKESKMSIDSVKNRPSHFSNLLV